MWIVQQVVGGKWLTVDSHASGKPTPRQFAEQAEAKTFAERISAPRQPARVAWKKES